jgi:hypothetical protein
MLRWKKPLPYTLAGGLNGVVSLIIFHFTGPAQFSGDFFAVCIIGGLAGGVAYWAAVGRFVAMRRSPA